MTKQDVYDIIAILEPLFEKKGLDIRKAVWFESNDDLLYDHERGFLISLDGIDDLTVRYSIATNSLYDRSGTKEYWKSFCSKYIENSQFLQQVCQYLSTILNILYVRVDENGVSIMLSSHESESHESLKLKKYHQF